MEAGGWGAADAADDRAGAVPVPVSCEHPGTAANAARPATPATRTTMLRSGERRRYQRTVTIYARLLA